MMQQVKILLIILSLLFAESLLAQRNRATIPHRPWTTFEGDTARYLEFNYTIRGVQYIGWTVGELLEELEFPIINITNETRRGGGGIPSRLVGLTLGIRQKGDVPNLRTDYYIEVRFQEPPLLEEFRGVSPVRNRTFTPEIYDFIRNLRISEVSSSQRILRDPELVEQRRRVFEENRRRGQEARGFLDRLNQAENEQERERLIEQMREQRREFLDRLNEREHLIEQMREQRQGQNRSQ